METIRRRTLPFSGLASWHGLIAVSALAIAVYALYGPFLSNPPIFDDKLFYSGLDFARMAATPFRLQIRQPSLFSFAVVQVLWGNVEAHRIVSMVLHIACAWLVFALVRAIHVSAAGPTASRLPAFAAAALFALHPMAVYGASYLAQRSIVLATAFSLVSLLLYFRGLRRGSYADAISSALFYSLAVLSKEQALLLPAVAACVMPLSPAARPFAIRYVAIHWITCAPAALLIVLLVKGIVGTPYEANFATVAEQISSAWGEELARSSGIMPWFASAITQAGLFFQYLALWVWPRTSAMSFDLRVDFVSYWSPATATMSVVGFFVWGATATFLLLKRPKLAPVGCGMLYVWILYIPELMVVRFQEPFVLYRSYFWAPGLAVMAGSAFQWIPRRALIAVMISASGIVAWQSQDRLRTFSSGLAVWEDAGAKLPGGPVPGGYRTLYELGREYLHAGRSADALAMTDKCLKLYPTTYECYFARAAVHLELEQDESALPYIRQAIELKPKSGTAYRLLGFALENLGCVEAAKAQYRAAVKLRDLGAQHRLDSLESPGKGLVAPRAARPASKNCAELATAVGSMR